MDFVKFFWQIGFVGKTVLIILLLMSIQSWAYIIYNFLICRKIARFFCEAEMVLEEEPKLSVLIRKIKEREENLIFQRFKMFIIWFDERYEKYLGESKGELWEKTLRANLLERDLEEKIFVEKEEFSMNLMKGLGFLATTGNVAPFIGLLGTVWGIMGAFYAIGLKGTATLATVAPGIAEALVNTAMGLFCAIPAVIAYNFFTIKRENMTKKLEIFYKKLLLILKKDIKI